jgi:hypothetical protein
VYTWISSDRSKISRADVDDGVFDFLCSIPLAVVERAVEEAVELDVSKIQNRSAYLMGVLKHKVSELSADPACLVTNPGSSDSGRMPSKRNARHVTPDPMPTAAAPRAEKIRGHSAASGKEETIDIFSDEPLKRKRGGKARPDLAATPPAPAPVKTAPAAERASEKTDFFSNEPLKRKRGGKARPDLAATSSSVEAPPSKAATGSTPASSVEAPPSKVAPTTTAGSMPSSLVDWDTPLPRKRGGRARAESSQ